MSARLGAEAPEGHESLAREGGSLSQGEVEATTRLSPPAAVAGPE